MSGGHYNYVFGTIEDIKIERGQEVDKKRLEFQRLLKLVAKAMHDIEWVDSGDTSEGSEYDAIDAVFSYAYGVYRKEAEK